MTILSTDNVCLQAWNVTVLVDQFMTVPRGVESDMQVILALLTADMKRLQTHYYIEVPSGYVMRKKQQQTRTGISRDRREDMPERLKPPETGHGENTQRATVRYPLASIQTPFLRNSPGSVCRTPSGIMPSSCLI